MKWAQASSGISVNVDICVDICLSHHVTESFLLVCDCPKARPLTNKIAFDQKCDAIGECYCPLINGRETLYREGIGCIFPGKLKFSCTLDKLFTKLQNVKTV